MHSLHRRSRLSGQAFPELKDAYIYGDWSTGRIWGIRHDKGKVTWHRELAKTSLQITGFGIDSRGELIVADHGGGWYQAERNPTADTASQFSQTAQRNRHFRLDSRSPRATGSGSLLRERAALVRWAHKERFIGLPGDSHVDFTVDNGWKCPNGTVIVKTFSLPNGREKPPHRNAIDDPQDGEWAGYSYAWNEEQTDATLVESGGCRPRFHHRPGRGLEPEANMAFSSRAECMVCHSRAANWLLGVTTAQINTATRDGNGAHDQLARLEKRHLQNILARPLERAEERIPSAISPSPCWPGKRCAVFPGCKAWAFGPCSGSRPA